MEGMILSNQQSLGIGLLTFLNSIYVFKSLLILCIKIVQLTQLVNSMAVSGCLCTARCYNTAKICTVVSTSRMVNNLCRSDTVLFFLYISEDNELALSEGTTETL